MKNKLSTDLAPENVKTVLMLLEETPRKLARLTGTMPPEQLTRPLGPGERTITEILAHLINGDTVNADAIYLALIKKEPLLHKLHAERDIGRLLQHDRYPYHELLAYFTFRRKVLINVLRKLSSKQWARTVREEGKQRRESVYWRARGQALHEFDHLSDIEAKLHKLLKEG
jgi:hypothetical protein